MCKSQKYHRDINFPGPCAQLTIGVPLILRIVIIVPEHKSEAMYLNTSTMCLACEAVAGEAAWTVATAVRCRLSA